MVLKELYNRSLLGNEHYGHLRELLLKGERLRRRFIRMEDRQQRLTLGSLGRVHRADIPYRVGVGYHEGMA